MTGQKAACIEHFVATLDGMLRPCRSGVSNRRGLRAWAAKGA
jgi:hypothetical protein